MSATNVSALSAGVQQLYSQGFLNQGLSTNVLKGASVSHCHRLANSTVANQESSTLLGLNSDSSNLSPFATNYLANNNSSVTDPLTTALNEALLAPGNAAASKYLPQNSANTGTQFSVVG